MKEMVGGCCVCSDERGWPENPLVYCDGQNCTVAVHQACYGIVTVPTGPWYCRKCESQERSARVRCELCPSRDGALKKTDNAGWAHVVCALYIPEVRFGNVTTMEPIILQLIPPERYAKSCYICQDIGKLSRATVGACMQCNKSGCKQQFHVTCAQALGLLCEEAGNYLDNVKYCGYCQHHYSKLKKGGNVKTIPPYKPISHDTDSSSGSSPEKDVEANISSSTLATSIKISSSNANSSSGIASSNSQSISSSKQRKSSSASKPSASGQLPAINSGTSGGSNSISQSSSSSSNKTSSSTSKDKDKHSSKSASKFSSSSKSQDRDSLNVNSSSSTRDKSSSKYSRSSSNKDSSGNSNSGGNSNVNNSEHGVANMPISSTNTHSSSTGSQIQNLSNSGNKDGFGSSLSNDTSNINTSGSSTKSSGGSTSKKRKADSLKISTVETIEVNSASFRDIIKDVSVTLIPLPIDKSDGGNEFEKGTKRPKTDSGSHSTHQTSHDLQQQHQSSTAASNLSSASSSTTSSHLKNSNLVIKDDSRLRAQSPHGSISNNTIANNNISGSQISSNNNQLTTSSISLSTTTTTTAVTLLSSSTLSSSVHNSNNSTNISGNNSSNNNNNNNNSGSTPSLYVSVPLSTANVPGVNIPSNASNGSASGTGGSGVSLSNVTSSSINTAGSNVGGKQSPRISGGFPSSTQPLHTASSLVASEHSKSIISGSSSSAAIQSNSSVIQPIVSPLGSTNSNLSASNESVNLTIKYEKQANFRVTKVQEQESGPARRSRTPDSGNYSNTSLSQASLSTSTSSLNNGGLKFSYEPQINSGTQSSALSPPIIDTNIGAVIKDSPQSSPSSESGSTVSRKRGRKSGETRNNAMPVSSNNGPIPMVLDSKSDCIKQENKILQNGTGTTVTPNSSSSSNSLNTAHHMLGNQINPSSSMAQKMSDMVHMEIQDHSIYSQDNGPQLIGVPFPGKRATPTNQNTPNSSTNPLTSMLTGTATSTPSGNTPQSLEQLLERQWEQGSQFLMEQAQHFDIASLLSCLHQLRTENIRLEEHVNSLIARRDHLLAVNARLAIPLTSNNTQNQVTTKKRRS